MSSLIDLFIQNNQSDTIAIIYIDSDSKISTLKYSEFWFNSDLIERKIRETTKASKNCVIGIYSEVNQLIPSFMIAILKNECLFCYISAHNNSLNKKLLFKTLNYVICHNKNRKLFQHFAYYSETNKKTDEYLFEDYIIIELNSKIEKFVKFDDKQLFAYLVTSSGTNGYPKHVYVPHSCITPNIVDLKEELKVSSDDTILICSPFTFDPSIVDLFIGLSSKSQIILIDNLIRISPEKLIKVIVNLRVTIMTVTPSLMSRFTLETIQKVLLSSNTHLRALLFGGEKSPSFEMVCNYIKFNNNKTIIYNIYGVTEVSSWATIYKFNSNDCFDDQFNCLPIFGRNLLDTDFSIDDKTNELIIKSNVRKCLVITFDENQFESNSQKWSNNYNTGDCAKVSKSGFVYITGRSDSIVKLNGIKCDLELIECKVELKFIHIIKKCVCIASEWHDIQNSIINVFITPKKEFKSEIKTIVSDFLFKEFNKSIAFNVIIIEYFPLTPHSKIDRLLLLKSLSNNGRENYIYKKINQTHHEIIEYFSDKFNNYLNISKADFCSKLSEFNFISSGGESITALQLSIDVQNYFNCDFPSLVDKILNNSLLEVCQYVHKVLTLKPKVFIEKEDEHKSNAIKGLNVLKKRNIEDSNDCLTVISRRGVNQFVSCSDGNCLRNDAKQMKSSDDELTFKAEILWSIDLFQCIDASPLIVERIHKKQSFISIGSHSGDLVLINRNDGTIIWQIQLSDRIESSAICDKSANNIFIGDYSGNFYCISLLNGIINWIFKTEAAIKSSPICSSKSDLVFCGSHDKHLYAWNQSKSDDQLIWKCLISDGSIFSSPILSSNEDLIFAATLDGILAAIRVDSGLILWKTNLKSALFSSPAIDKDILVIGSTQSSVNAININDGTILWSFNTSKPVFSSPVFSNNSNDEGIKYVFIGTHNNSLICLDLSSGQMKWQFNTSSPVYSTPFISSFQKFNTINDYVLISETNGILHLINANDGNQLFSFQLKAQIFSSPVIYDKKIFIGCRDNYFYCISIK